MAAGTSEHVLDGAHIEQLPIFGPLQVSIQLLRSRPDRQVEQHPRNSRYRDPLTDRPILLSQDRREVDPKVPLRPPSSRRRYVHHVRRKAQ